MIFRKHIVFISIKRTNRTAYFYLSLIICGRSIYFSNNFYLSIETRSKPSAFEFDQTSWHFLSLSTISVAFENWYSNFPDGYETRSHAYACFYSCSSLIFFRKGLCSRARSQCTLFKESIFFLDSIGWDLDILQFDWFCWCFFYAWAHLFFSCDYS